MTKRSHRRIKTQIKKETQRRKEETQKRKGTQEE